MEYNDTTATSTAAASANSFFAGEAPSTAPGALGTSGDWSAYLDESKGLIYYFNPRTSESKWEAPEGVDFSDVQTKIGADKKVEMRERLKGYLEERLNDSATEFEGAMQKTGQADDAALGGNNIAQAMMKSIVSESSTAKNKVVPANAKGTTATNNNNNLDDDDRRDIVSEWSQWQALADNKRGRIYYYNKTTRESRWERPAGFPAFKLSASKRVALEERRKRYEDWHRDAAKVNVLGKGVVTVSDSSFDDGSAVSSVVSGPVPEVVPEAKADLSRTNNGVVEAQSNVEEKSDVTQPPTLPITQQGEWSAYFDIKSGLVYYFNEETAETSWDPPYADFPRIIMEGATPTVLESGSGNISMERALGYIGVDEMAEALAWEEAKNMERARKAAMRAAADGAAKIEKEGASVTSGSEVEKVELMYEAAKKAELERLDQEKKLAEEQKAKEEVAAKLAEEENLKQEKIAAEETAAKEREVAAAKLAQEEKLQQERIAADGAAARITTEERLKQERIAAEEATLVAKEREAAAKLAKEEMLRQERIATEEAAAAKEREAAAKLAIQEKLEQERLEKECIMNERLKKERFESEEKRKVERKLKQPVPLMPVPPKEDPTLTAKNVETMVAPLKTRTLYDILQCPTTATRVELKRSYLSLAKESHPDALLQYGMETNKETERKFVEIAHAWKVLGDSMTRRRYDRELKAKGLSSKAGNVFESWVMGAAKAMDEALAKAEGDLESGDVKRP